LNIEDSIDFEPKSKVGKRTSNRRLIGMIFLVFLCYNFVFIYGKNIIDKCNRACFSFTGELAQKTFEEKPDALAATQVASKTPAPPPKEPEKKYSGIDHAHPVTLDLKKTSPPVIPMCAGIPDFDSPDIPEFPQLRTYKGEEWSNERTVIKMTCDGENLYAYFKCFDASPKNIVTEYSRNQGATAAWMDDSIELFLKKDQISPNYCQYIASASGVSLNNCYASGAMPFDFKDVKNPVDFQYPEFEVYVMPDGFEVFMTIGLSNVGIEQPLKPGDKILMQISRNYRGQKENGAHLQLFPNYIYGDTRLPMDNHDRRTFIPVAIGQ